MKAERRQELRQNDLGALLLDITDWLKKYTVQIAAAGGAIVVILLVSEYVTRSRAGSLEGSLESLASLNFAAGEAQQSFQTIDQLIDDSGSDQFRMRALLTKSRQALAAATAVTDGGFKPEYLDSAEEACQELLSQFGNRAPIAGSALSMLATIEENRFAADQQASHQEKARNYLNRLASEAMFKGTPFQTQAAARLKTLDEVFQMVALAPALPPSESALSIPSASGPSGSVPPIQIRSSTGEPLDIQTRVIPKDAATPPPDDGSEDAEIPNAESPDAESSDAESSGDGSSEEESASDDADPPGGERG